MATRGPTPRSGRAYLQLNGLEQVRILDARYNELAEDLLRGKVCKRVKDQ